MITMTYSLNMYESKMLQKSQLKQLALSEKNNMARKLSNLINHTQHTCTGSSPGITSL